MMGHRQVEQAALFYEFSLSKVRRGCRQRRPAGPSKNIWLCSITRPPARRPK